MSLDQYLKHCHQRIETALQRFLPQPQYSPQTLHEAMRYASLDGGKRIRPVLVYAAGGIFQTPEKQLDGPACAVELIHAYSLVHDDLPAMDNDTLRRGKATCHIAFDEATALLVGDALQSLAFDILASDPEMTHNKAIRLQMVQNLAQASGSLGMAGGQAIDLQSVGQKLSLEQLKNMHLHKTGALIRASIRLGALSHPEINEKQLNLLDDYAKCIGLAFQIQDDILDVESDTQILGKTQGSDISKNKPTYPAIIGLAQAKTMAASLVQDALSSLSDFGATADPLRWIAHYIVTRRF